MRPYQHFGAGVGGLVNQVRSLPTALELARQAIGDADTWWAGQGRHPPALDLQVSAPPAGETAGAMGYGIYNSGTVDVNPQYLQNLDRILKGTRGRSVALVGLWRLMAHERGHNTGLGHIPGGIMDATWAAPPGEAYKWARSVLRPPVGRHF